MSKSKAVRVRIEGAFFIYHSLANVNRQLAIGLADAGFDVSIVPTEPPLARDRTVADFDALSKMARVKPAKANLVIRHAFPPNLCPTEEPLVLMQPWEFFAAPNEWVQFVNRYAAELWVYSNFTRASYVRSGVEPRKVTCLPLGLRGGLFSPHAIADPALRALPEFKFLYVGGSITRKGIDVLLQAYTEEFAGDEPVRLVVKDIGTQHVYRHNNWGEQIQKLAGDKNAPKATYIDEDLPDDKLAGIFEACDCLVAPYRAEGFCLPVLEAMASRKPVIVTSGGPTDDLVLHGCGWKIGSKPVHIEQLPGLESSLAQAWLEPDIADLRAAMREAYEERDGLTKELGRNAMFVAGSHFGWNQVIPLYANRIHRIVDSGPGPRQRTGHAKHQNISLCMIVRNEERVLEDCLKSAKPYFDEIVIVDTGSTDKTKEIAAKYADKVLDFPWCDDFSAARNVSLEAARGDWIFWMDADDTLPPETGQAIRSATWQAKKDIVAFVVPVQFLELGSPNGTRVDHVKLIRNFPGIKFEHRIHEQVLPSIRRHGGSLARLDAVVLHSGYDTSESGQAKKKIRDHRILTLEYRERKEHPFVLFNIGMTRQNEGRHAAAIMWLEKCLSRSHPDDTIVRKAYALLAISHRELGNPEKALEIVEKGLEIIPGDPELHFHCGMLLTQLGRFEQAIEQYKKAHGVDIRGHFSSVDMGIVGFKSSLNVANVYRTMGRFRDAKDWYLKAIAESPDFSPSVFELFDSSLECGDMNTAIEMLHKVEAAEGQSENWAKMLVRRADIASGKSSAMLTLQQAIARNPTPTIGARLVLARLLLESGQEAKSLPLLNALAGENVAEAAYLLGVFAVRQGDFKGALPLMERALELNPGHVQTREQVENLRAALHGKDAPE